MTEFLPVSSSAHLALVRRLLRRDNSSPALDVALHLATALALIVAGGDELLTPPAALLRDLARHRFRVSSYSEASRTALLVLLANTPVALAGAALYRSWSAGRGRQISALLMLAAGSGVMAAAEYAERRRTAPSRGIGITEALVIGIAQAAALLPGLSRSGITVAAGMFVGLDRAAAERFSVMLGAPVTLAAAVRALPALIRLRHDAGWAAPAAGIAASFAGGLVGVRLLRPLLRRHGLLPFALYRLALAAVVGFAGRDGGPPVAHAPSRPSLTPPCPHQRSALR